MQSKQNVNWEKMKQGQALARACPYSFYSYLKRIDPLVDWPQE